ncbi:MAG: DUF1800 family protein, partial [Pseudomonadota bacterium]
LIQRFTASSPTPDYIERVALAFEAGRFTAPNGTRFGTGERGDLAATLAAVLLDEDVHSDTALSDPTAGKIREPILKYLAWAHAFDVANADADDTWLLYDTRSTATRLGQHPFRSPSVFNFYRPGYVAPASESGAADLTAPELQVITSGSTNGYTNFMTRFTFERVRQGDVQIFVPDYTSELALASTPEQLVDHLDTLLTGGQLGDQDRSAIIAAVEALEIREDADQAASDRRKRVQVAVQLMTNTAAFAIVR